MTCVPATAIVRTNPNEAMKTQVVGEAFVDGI